MTRLDVPMRLNRSAHLDQEEHVKSARWLLADLGRLMPSGDLAEVAMLDMGCGTKFSEAIVNEGMAIGSYHGVDVDAEVIAFLQSNNDDPRFTYHHLSVENELYNPDVRRMTAEEDLGCGDRTFDLITLFSVFTHLAPHDYVTMLHLLRRYAAPDGILVFTTFIDELTEGGYGFTDVLSRAAAGVEEADWNVAEKNKLRAPDVKPYVDLDPDRPLVYAMYSREYSLELIDGTGWAVREIRDPNPYAQHQVICTPI